MSSTERPATYSVAEVAAKLGRSRTKVYALIEDGYLDVLPGRGAMLVTTESWDRYLASAGPRPKSQAPAT